MGTLCIDELIFHIAAKFSHLPYFQEYFTLVPLKLMNTTIRTIFSGSTIACVDGNYRPELEESLFAGGC